MHDGHGDEVGGRGCPSKMQTPDLLLGRVLCEGHSGPKGGQSQKRKGVLLHVIVRL